MGYNSAEELVKGSKSPETKLVRLAEVTSLDSKGRAKVRFYGEDSEAGKTYSYIEGYIPEKGDKVLMLGQGNTFIILGAVEAEEVVVRYALKDHTHNYADKEHPHQRIENGKKTLTVTTEGEVVPGEDSKYSIGTSSAAFANAYIDNVVLSYITLGNTKYDGADILGRLYDPEDTDYYVVMEDGTLVPYTNQGVSLGTASKAFKNVYAKSIYANGKEVNPSKLIDATASGRSIQLSSSALEPSVDDAFNLGTVNYRFLRAYAKTFYGDSFHMGEYDISPSRVYSNSRTDRYVEMVDNTLTPNQTAIFSLGSASRQFANIYSKNIYLDGSAVTTSDKRKKKFIRKLSDKYMELFKKLRPVTFKYKKGTSGRTHAGFIAQEVEQAMKDCGITNEEFGGVVIQDNGDYGLRYEEFIALQTAAIHDLQNRVEELERRVNNDRV